MKKIIVLLLMLMAITNGIEAQNVAINGTGAAPAASAMLDITSTTSGLLIPRMSTAQKNAIASPATGLTVYDTTTNSFWFFDGTSWVELSSSSTGWLINGNNLTSAGILGSLTNQAVRFFSNNTERMRLFTNGRLSINSTTSPGQLFVSGSFAPSVGNDGSIVAVNTNASGIAVNAAGQNQANNGLGTGSGGAFVGNTTGLTSFYTTGGVGEAIYTQDGFGANVRVLYWTGAAYRKIIGSGTVSTLVKGLNNEELIMNCPEAPENLFMDYGHGKLKNGYAKIIIDPIFSKNIIVNEDHPLKVFIQLEGDCNGVYVFNKTSESFEVKELKNGNSNVEFTYSIIATHGDEEYISENNIIRKAKYDKRWEKANDKRQTIKPLIPSENPAE